MGAEDQCDREVDKGQVNASESREDGVKLSSDGEVAGKAVVSKDVSLERFDKADLGRVCWRGNGVWNGQEDVNDTLVSVVRDHDQLVDVVVTCVGPVIECSTTEMGHVKLMELEWHWSSEEASMPLSILEKLRRLKGFLNMWNREYFDTVDLQIEVTTNLLNDLEGE
ncbi:hypothetical protein V6N12_023875 [Hibiscus sabdariffa]|uniref:Uncharacterized protein n=1 Tax=Hibiscus sabdariffa TaxID=183260 RepID=A0ABR2FYY6_9ROSI